MKILVFEWMLGGGLWVDRQAPDEADSIWQQGAAMCRTVADDFTTAGCEVLVPVDARVRQALVPGRRVSIAAAEQLPLVLGQLAAEADRLFLIAPESQGRLVRVLDWVEAEAQKLLSPSRPWVELCGDKDRCLRHLAASGVKVPAGVLWKAGLDRWPPPVPLPAIIKPNDGCGGEEFRQCATEWSPAPQRGAWRIESQIEGEPISVSVLAGPKGQQLLQPTIQHFADGRLGDYAGGQLVTDRLVAELAREAAAGALAGLAGMWGMFGFDLVVDRVRKLATVIEINPRLTSSYLGLRQAYAENLPGCLLALFDAGLVQAPILNLSQAELAWSLLDDKAGLSGSCGEERVPARPQEIKAGQQDDFGHSRRLRGDG